MVWGVVPTLYGWNNGESQYGDYMVVIPTTGKNPWRLAGMIASIEAQTILPSKVVVVLDGKPNMAVRQCVDGFRGYSSALRFDLLQQHVGDGSSGNPARNVGLEVVDTPFVLFLDDDDTIRPDYVERLAQGFTAPNIAAVYPQMRFCGQANRLWADPYDPETLSRTNLSGAVALMRTDALRQVGGWPEIPKLGSFRPSDDWALWRRFQAFGWAMAAGDAVYDYHKHGAGICESHRANHHDNWLETVDYTFNLVTIAVPFAGRHWCLDRLLEAIASQTFPLKYCQFLFYDNSCDPRFGADLKTWLSAIDCAGSQYIKDDRPIGRLTPTQVADGPLDRNGYGGKVYGREVTHRVGSIWNRISQLVTTDFVWCVEDDVIPPADCLESLLRKVRPDVDAVCGCYDSRAAHGFPVAWEYRGEDCEHIQKRSGFERIDGTGFGCVLIRRKPFQQVTATSGGRFGYDQNFWRDYKHAGFNLWMNWDLECEHLRAPRTANAPC